MKKLLLLLLVFGVAPAFAQIVAVPPCVPTTTCLLNTNNSWTARNLFTQGVVPGQLSVASMLALPSPSFGTLVTVLDGLTTSDCSAGSGSNVVVCMYSGSWIPFGVGGVNCPSGTSAIPYFNGTSNTTQCDQHASFDGSGNLTGVTGAFSGLLTALGFSTSGPGGILALQFQQPPTTFNSNTAYVYANANTGLIDCLKTGSVECFNGIQAVLSGSTVLGTTLVSANGGCNVYTSTATGLTSSNRVLPLIEGVDVTSVTGYAPGQLEIYPPFASSNLVTFKVCNPTASPITPASLTVFWIAL